VEFGKHWVLVTMSDHYAQMIKSYGKHAWELLGNLNLMHTHIRSTFLHYKPPHFELEPLDEHTAQFHYQSVRKGMTPFVSGLLAGIAELYGENIEVLNVEHLPVEEGEHTVFTLRRS
jgi:guanylate cyclase soluble subunit beta